MENLGLDDALNDASTDSGARKGISRRTIMKGAAWTVPALMVSTAAPAYAASLTCAIGSHTTIGRGKLVSGTVFSLNLDTLASVNGVRSNAPGPQASETGYINNGSNSTDWVEYSNPLSVSVLSALQISATGLTSGTVTPILSNIAPAGVGSLNQYSYASSRGLSKGASGVVVDNGDTALTPNSGYPDFGTLDLKTLLTPILGPAAFTTASIANLGLQIGAIAGRTRADVCSTPGLLTRDYLVNHLRLIVTSPLVASLAATVRTAVLGVSLPVGVKGGLAVDVSIIANGSNGATPPAAANPPLPLPSGSTQPIQANLGTVTTANGIPGGSIVIDLSTLMGSAAANPFGQSAQPFLNGLPANSILFVDNGLQVPGNAVSNFTAALIAGLEDRLLDAVSLTIKVLSVEYSGTLRQLLANSNPAVVAIAAALQTTINALFTTTLASTISAIGTLVTTVFGWLKNTINVTLNVQNVPGDNNAPAIGTAHPGPSSWSFAPRHDVAAIGVYTAPGASTANGLLSLWLARGSGGVNT